MLDFIKQNWDIISADPATFITIVGLTAFVVFGFAKLHYSGVIATLQQGLSNAKDDKERLKEEIERLKGKETELIAVLKNYESNFNCAER